MTQQNPVTVLLTGASGFIGKHIEAALKSSGYRVLRGVSAKHCGAGDIAIDFAKDNEDDWQQRFYQNPIEIVINAVGVLRDSRARPIEATHQSGPIALFNACTQHNVKRVIQISALGIEDNPTDYARTKRAADEHLLKLAENSSLSAAVVRPSIVFGQGGASSALFMNLAKLPLVCLPKPVLKARVQPLAVTDLAQAVVALIEDKASGIIQCAGSEALLLADFIDGAQALPAWTAAELGALIKTVLKRHQAKMPKLAIALRVAVLGCAQSPSVDAVLALLGRDVVLERLRGIDHGDIQEMVRALPTEG